MSSTPPPCEDICLSSLEHLPEDPHIASLDCCYPASSSTVLSSSSLLRTPPEEIAQHDPPSASSMNRNQFEVSKEALEGAELRAGTYYDATRTSGTSCSDDDDSEEEPQKTMQTQQRPRFYSLESHAAQLEFAQDLEKLLLAVLKDQNCAKNEVTRSLQAVPVTSCREESLYAPSLDSSNGLGVSTSPSAAKTTRAPPPHGNDIRLYDGSCSASLTISPKKQNLSPPTYDHSFVYVNVDEYNDHSLSWNDTSSSSYDSATSPQAASSRSSAAALCHSSKPALAVRTPLPVAAISVPPAPKKVLRHFHLSNPSQTRPAQSAQLSQIRKRPSQPTTANTPYTDYMRSNSCSQRDEGAWTLRRRVTPPQVDVPVDTQPQNKRQRLSPVDSNLVQERRARTLASRFLAKEPASLRRAASLRSEISVADLLDEADIPPGGIVTATYTCSLCSAFHPTDLDCSGSANVHPHGAESQNAVTCPPTEPSSPSNNSCSSISRSNSLLPLIAPPVFELIPRAPLTKTESAELRVLTLRHKDGHERRFDGLSMHCASTVPLNEEQNMTEIVSQPTNITVKENEKESRLPSSPMTEESDEELMPKLGIQESFRMKVVQWMLDVLPPSFSSKPKLCSNLRAQLLDSPDTRWHAGHMFTRYFLRLGTSPGSSPPIIDESCRKLDAGDCESSRVLNGKEALTWDLAVACMALAVKFHRDVLPPLYPVTAHEFLIIAPHTMEYDDLESAQRDLLSALSFSIGSNTPAAYMEEFWSALPSLRTLIEKRGNWEVTKIETWELLYDTLLDASYLNYPTHILTGCALVLGAVECLVLTMKAESADKLRLLASGRAQRTKRREAECTCAKLQRKARKVMKNVELDVRDLLGAPEELWNKCMRWLETIAED